MVNTIFDTISEAKVVTGPITINPTDKETNITIIGSTKNFTTSGTNLLKNFSHFEAK